MQIRPLSLAEAEAEKARLIAIPRVQPNIVRLVVGKVSRAADRQRQAKTARAWGAT